MSEYGTRIASQASGDFIATREAYETDIYGNTRTLQIVGFSSRQIVVHPPLRGYPTPVSVADSTDLTNLPAELSNNIIDIGDTNILVVDVEHTASDGSVTITPLIFNESETTVLAIRASKTSGMGSVTFRRGASSGNYVSPQLQWDTLGASKIGLHISVIGGTANGVILKGGALSPRVEPTTTTTTTSSSTTTTTA